MPPQPAPCPHQGSLLSSRAASTRAGGQTAAWSCSLLQRQAKPLPIPLWNIPTAWWGWAEGSAGTQGHSPSPTVHLAAAELPGWAGTNVSEHGDGSVSKASVQLSG